VDVGNLASFSQESAASILRAEEYAYSQSSMQRRQIRAADTNEPMGTDGSKGSSMPI
jgi:hypothetical protein